MKTFTASEAKTHFGLFIDVAQREPVRVTHRERVVGVMVAFPASMRLKLIGVLICCVAVQAANILRVISLYYLGKWDKEVFDFAHLYLWQALMMLDVLVVWLLWIRAVAKKQGASLAA